MEIPGLAPTPPTPPIKVELTDIVVRQSAKILLFRYFLAELLFAGALIIFLFLLRAFSRGSNLPPVYFIDLIILAIIFFDILVRGALELLIISQWIGQTYILKRDRLVISRGTFSPEEIEINYSLITSVDLRQGTFGNLLNYGTIVLNVSGRGEVDLPDIPDPLAYKSLLDKILPLRQRLEITLKKS